MATRTTEKVTEQKVAETKKIQEAKYNVSELAENATKIFGSKVRRECVIAAFRIEGINEAPLSEAKKIVEKFMKREVK